MANDLYSLLSAIQKRPGMYLRRTSLTELTALIHGFRYAIESSGGQIEEVPPFGGFQSWVVMKLQSTEPNVYWSDLLLNSRNGHEEMAFEEFFACLWEFKNKEEKKLLSVQLPLPSTPRTEKVLRPDGRYYREAPVYSVQIVEYIGVKGVFVRVVEANGKLKSETYCESLENGLKYAEFLHGIKKEDWKSTENRKLTTDR